MCEKNEHSHLLQIVNIVSVSSRVINKVSVLLDDNSKAGGRFVVIQNEGRKATVINTTIGIVPINKKEKYRLLVLEKGKRLQLNSNDLTSYESRNPEARVTRYITCDNLNEIDPWGWWGGAVRGKDLIFSFSGFPELSEEEAELRSEAAMFVAAIILKQLDKEEVLSKINEERNPFLRPSLKVCV